MEPSAVVVIVIVVLGGIASVETALTNYRGNRLPRKRGGIGMPPMTTDQRGMRSLGEVSKHPEINAIVTAIIKRKTRFSLPENPHRLRVRLMGQGGVYAVDHDRHRYVAQDSTKNSAEAARVREGASIIWIIKTHGPSNQPLPKGVIIGRVEDGIVYMR